MLVGRRRRLGRAAARRSGRDVQRRRRLRRRATCQTFPEAIVIGIANTRDRIYEYTPTTDPTHARRRRRATISVDDRQRAQAGDRHAAAHAARRRVDRDGRQLARRARHRVRRHDARRRVRPARRAVAVDVVEQRRDRRRRAGDAGAPRPLDVYVDSGQGAPTTRADTDMLAAAYTNLGYVDGANFRHVVQAGAQHDETYWAERFPARCSSCSARATDRRGDAAASRPA